MAKENPQEIRVLVAFFSSVGCSLGFYDRKSKSLRNGVEDEPLYITNRDMVRRLLKDGWNAPDLEKYLWERYRVKDRAALICDVVPTKPGSELQEEDNILILGKDYHHPRLYKKSPPVYSTSNDSISPVSRGSVSLVDCFTLRDLVDYYLREAYEIVETIRTRSSILGVMRWLLQDCSVDEILTAIDLATECNPSISPVKIEGFVSEAKQEVKLRMGNA